MFTKYQFPTPSIHGQSVELGVVDHKKITATAFQKDTVLGVLFDKPIGNVLGAFVVDFTYFRQIFDFGGKYNGYLIVSNEEMNLGDYDNANAKLLDVNCYIHGGITFSQEITDENQPFEIDSVLGRKIRNATVYGFDTCHSDDTEQDWQLPQMDVELRKFLRGVVAYYCNKKEMKQPELIFEQLIACEEVK